MKKLKKVLIKFFLGIAPLFFIVATILVFALYHTHEKSEEIMYNNGIHEEDGGKQEIVSVYKGGNYYACDKCGKVIHIYSTNN